MISPQRRRGAETSAEKSLGDGDWWRVRGVRFDAETRRRGERRGERERVGARDPRVGRGGARRQRRKARPSFARIGKLKHAPPRQGALCHPGSSGERWRARGVRFDAETRRRGGRRGEQERVGAMDSRVGRGGARRQRRKKSPSCARIDRLKPVPPQAEAHAPPRHGGALCHGGASYLFFQLTMSALIPSPPGWPSAPRETISGSSTWCSPGKR